MTQPAKLQEPSMEEILASIRRIIADDDASKTAQVAVEPAPRPAAPPEPAAAPEEEPAAPAAAGGDMEDNAADMLNLTEFDGRALIQSSCTGPDARSGTAIS